MYQVTYFPFSAGRGEGGSFLVIISLWRMSNFSLTINLKILPNRGGGYVFGKFNKQFADKAPINLKNYRRSYRSQSQRTVVSFLFSFMSSMTWDIEMFLENSTLQKSNLSTVCLRGSRFQVKISLVVPKSC